MREREKVREREVINSESLQFTLNWFQTFFSVACDHIEYLSPRPLDGVRYTTLLDPLPCVSSLHFKPFLILQFQLPVSNSATMPLSRTPVGNHIYKLVILQPGTNFNGPAKLVVSRKLRYAMIRGALGAFLEVICNIICRHAPLPRPPFISVHSSFLLS